jgi:PAS domain S-box-containing protein
MTTVLFAIDNPAEQSLFREVIDTRNLDMDMIVPRDIREVDALIERGVIDIIVTDLSFRQGGFAEWLFLWQHPFILLADWSEYERVADMVQNQTSDFAIRDAELRHIRFLPLVIRKILNNQEAMQRHNLNLKMSEDRYRELVQAIPDIVYSLDAEGKFVFVNDAISRLGWTPIELIGQHFSTILDPEYVQRVSRRHVLASMSGVITGDDGAPKLFDERRRGERRTTDLEVKLRRKESPTEIETLFGAVIAYGEVNAVGFDSMGEDYGEPGSVGIIRDITARREATTQVKQSLQEKETLLAEIHHRVKNNLQVISSLLNLQAGGVIDPEAQQRFADAQMQIQSMALVHEHLYQSHDYGRVQLADYVESLCDHLFDSYAVPRERISLSIAIDPIEIGMRQAIPVALLLNELVSNSLKYAFPENAHGTVTISATTEPETTASGQHDLLRLSVTDDGVGLPTDFDIADSRTLGHTLVSGLASQLGSSIEIDGRHGTHFEIAFAIES